MFLYELPVDQSSKMLQASISGKIKQKNEYNEVGVGELWNADVISNLNW